MQSPLLTNPSSLAHALSEGHARSLVRPPCPGGTPVQRLPETSGTWALELTPPCGSWQVVQPTSPSGAGLQERVLKQRPGRPWREDTIAQRMVRSRRALRPDPRCGTTPQRLDTGPAEVSPGDSRPKVRAPGVVGRMAQATRSHGGMYPQRLPHSRRESGGIVWAPARNGRSCRGRERTVAILPCGRNDRGV